ncbi:MAG: TerC family protein [Chloroflexia bacterium]|nr:TerC family protein [Chloroflexia bacterium]
MDLGLNFDLDLMSRILRIVVIDLVLSGDNAVVIGMAARSLSLENRRRAIIFGGAGAVGLRILFTAMAALLLDVPYLQAFGGVLLLWIAYKLIKPQDHGTNITEAGSLSEAIRTIVLADVVMSLDNILAVGGAAHGSLVLLLFGLALSVPILLLGSELVSRMLGRFPLLVYLGVIVLILTAVEMILGDALIHERFDTGILVLLAVSLLLSVAIIGVGRRKHSASVAGGDPEAPRVEDQLSSTRPERDGTAGEVPGSRPPRQAAQPPAGVTTDR